MDRFEILNQIDEGAFGLVQLAINTKTKEKVAIKKLKKKFKSWNECLALREIKSLQKLKHPNIIKLKEVFKLDQELFLVFEYAEENLLKFYINCFKNQNISLGEPLIRSLIFQTALGLSYMHKNGYFHRDLKPENLLVTSQNIVKIIDFGLAREIRSSPPYTDYVATRWYRAPEILLKSQSYNSPVDIFALGSIMAELYLLTPLFKGNSEIDQMSKICYVLGTPPRNWSEGYRLAQQVGFSFPNYPAIPFENIFPMASHEAIDLLKSMLQYDSIKRPTASQILQHPFFMNEKKNDIYENVLKVNNETGNSSTSRNFKTIEKLNNKPTNYEEQGKSLESTFLNKILKEKENSNVSCQNFNSVLQQTHSKTNNFGKQKLNSLVDDDFDEKLKYVEEQMPLKNAKIHHNNNVVSDFDEYSRNPPFCNLKQDKEMLSAEISNGNKTSRVPKIKNDSFYSKFEDIFKI